MMMCNKPETRKGKKVIMRELHPGQGFALSWIASPFLKYALEWVRKSADGSVASD